MNRVGNLDKCWLRGAREGSSAGSKIYFIARVVTETALKKRRFHFPPPPPPSTSERPAFQFLHFVSFTFKFEIFPRSLQPEGYFVCENLVISSVSRFRIDEVN